MGADGHDDLARLDYDSPEFNQNYDRYLHDILNHCPLAHNGSGPGHHIVGRYSDVQQVASDWKTFSSAHGIRINGRAGHSLTPMEEADPPSHDVWRAALNPFFSILAVRRHRTTIRSLVTELIDGFIERGHCDFAAEFAIPLADQGLRRCYLPDVPDRDAQTLLVAARQARFGANDATREDNWTVVETYMDDYLQERVRQPRRRDWLDALLRVEAVDGASAAWEDKVGVATDLIVANAPTSHAIAGVAFQLARDPFIRRVLASSDAHHRAAVEEIIRVHAPVVAVPRCVTADVEVAGSQLKAGEWVTAGFAAAARDPEVFEDPDDVSLSPRFIRNAAFGFGVHRCIGVHFARQEVRTTLEEVLRRMPDIALQDWPPPKFLTTMIGRTVTSLLVTFTPGRRYDTP
jgi:cytochrome P450